MLLLFFYLLKIVAMKSKSTKELYFYRGSPSSWFRVYRRARHDPGKIVGVERFFWCTRQLLVIPLPWSWIRYEIDSPVQLYRFLQYSGIVDTRTADFSLPQAVRHIFFYPNWITKTIYPGSI